MLWIIFVITLVFFIFILVDRKIRNDNKKTEIALSLIFDKLEELSALLEEVRDNTHKETLEEYKASFFDNNENND